MYYSVILIFAKIYWIETSLYLKDSRRFLVLCLLDFLFVETLFHQIKLIFPTYFAFTSEASALKVVWLKSSIIIWPSLYILYIFAWFAWHSVTQTAAYQDHANVQISGEELAADLLLPWSYANLRFNLLCLQNQNSGLNSLSPSATN